MDEAQTLPGPRPILQCLLQCLPTDVPQPHSWNLVTANANANANFVVVRIIHPNPPLPHIKFSFPSLSTRIVRYRIVRHDCQ